MAALPARGLPTIGLGPAPGGAQRGWSSLTPHVAGVLRRPSVGTVGRESRWARWTPLPLAAQSKGALIRMSTPPPGNCGLRGEGSTPVPLPPPVHASVFSG
jgi:hypothetical protein